MDATYLFYDLETSGLSKCFDQVLQFAAIRTDLELNELERFEFFVKLNSDVIPSPKAIITNRISLKKLEAKVILEFEGISKIHELFNTPNTISIGYNTLGFGDEFLRFSFYRNLLPPYTHQYNKGCSRIDLYPIAALYYLFNNEALAWPKSDGNITLKLEHLNAINNLSDGANHDAMVDVRATLELARRFIKKRAVWNFACGYFIKATDLKRTEQLPEAFHVAGQSYREGLMIDGIFGAANYYHAPVVNLGVHNHYKNQTLWLRIDNEKLLTTTLESIKETTNIYRKKVGEVGLLLPSNSRFTVHLSKERLKLWHENKLWLEKNPKLLTMISEYYREYKYPVIPNVDLDARLYLKDFRNSEEETLCRKFQIKDHTAKLALLSELPNGDLRDQMLRVLGRNYRDFLPSKIAAEFNDYLTKALSDAEDSILVDYRGTKRLTPKTALSQIMKLRNGSDLTEEQLNLLNELETYILEIQKSL
jgi:exodeoxyribonuclease I